MSFASDTKEELCKIEPDSLLVGKALFYGMCLFGGSFSKQKMSFTFDSYDTLSLFIQMINGYANIRPEISQEGEHSFRVYLEEEDQRKKLLFYFGYTGDEPTLRIRKDELGDDELRAAFLRGCFLACGHLSHPQSGYHMEFVVPHLKLSQDLSDVIAEALLRPKSIQRKGMYVLYLKDSESIEDMLTLLGAVQASMKMMNIKIFKDLRNHANRVTNCETANIDKTVAASRQQILDIKEIQNSNALSKLSDDLLEMAQLRLAEPEISLRELGQKLSKPLSRSGVYHRFDKIHELAEGLRAKRQSEKEK